MNILEDMKVLGYLGFLRDFLLKYISYESHSTTTLIYKYTVVIHTIIHTAIHTAIHTDIHTTIHTVIHTIIHTVQRLGVLVR